MKPRKQFESEAEEFVRLLWEQRIYKDENMDKETLLELLDLQSMQFIKMCKRNFDMTFKKIFKHCKVAEIKQRLVETDGDGVEMEEIADEMGYSGSYGYSSMFHRDFKSVAEMTPMEFIFFHRHFKETTGLDLANYQRPEQERFLPEDGQPTFLSNFLNKISKNL